MNLIDVTRTFQTEDDALQFLEQMRWPDGIRCPTCGCNRISKITRKSASKNKRTRVYQCLEKTCKQQFSPTRGTIFGDSHIPVKTWFMAIAFILDAKKGMSAMQLQRHLGLKSYESAWYLAHRIRKAMESDGGLLSGVVEIDETYIGGKSTTDTKFAAKAIRAAVSLTATLKQQHRPASPEFFQNSVATLNAVGRAHPRPQLSNELINARVALAEYRSSVTPEPTLPPTQPLPTGASVAEVLNHHATYLVSESLPIRTGFNVYSNGAAIYSATLPGTDILTVVIDPTNLRAPSVNGLTLIGPRQILDGIEWKNVTFVNVHIVYAGGPLMLENVRFVNCTFEVPHNQQGIDVVDYAALSASSLTIG